MYDRSRFYGRDGRDCPSGDWMDRIRGEADDCCKRGPTGATGPTRPGRAARFSRRTRSDGTARRNGRDRCHRTRRRAYRPDGTHWSYRFDRSYRNGLLRKVNYL